MERRADGRPEDLEAGRLAPLSGLLVEAGRQPRRLPDAPLPLGRAIGSLARCSWRTAVLLAGGHLHQPCDFLGTSVHFADGTAAEAYRETAVDRPPPEAPAILLVAIRLRAVRGSWAHAAFRRESVLNTLLFAGFPGFVSKLWLRHDQRGVYRGLYEWDDAELAVAYVRALWWPLALVSEAPSIRYTVLPGLRRDELLADPSLLDGAGIAPAEDWWRLSCAEGGAAP